MSRSLVAFGYPPLVAASPPPPSTLPMEGFAANVTGGAGGTVRPVTNLLNAGPGSLRQAVLDANATSGPSIVDVQVSGIITLNSTITANGPDLTITGANAPGPFLLRASQTSLWDGALLNVAGSNILIEHLRFHRGLGDPTKENGKNVAVLSGDGIYFRHCSFAWADDEPFTVFGSAKNITLQYCLIYEPLRYAHHYEGGLIRHDKGIVVANSLGTGGPPDSTSYDVRFTLAQSIVAHAYERIPALIKLPAFEIINVITYNWENPFQGGGFSRDSNGTAMTSNIRGCMFLEGPQGVGSHPIGSDSGAYPPAYTHIDDCMWQKTGPPLWTEETDPVDIDRKAAATPGILSGTPIVFSPAVPTPTTIIPRAELWAHLSSRVGAIQPSRSASDTRLLAQIDAVVSKTSLAGSMVDTPTAEDTNQNPSATVTVYNTWSEAL